MIDWNGKFDRIFCINLSQYTNRREGMLGELRRIGILESENFSWKYTVLCPMYQILFDVMKKHGYTECRTQTEFNIAMANFECIKSAYVAGCENVLIMEDDIRFLKDIDKIEQIFDATPSDYDAVNYNPHIIYGKTLDECCKPKVNEFFSRYDMLHSTGCYALSRRAMKEILHSCEIKLKIADWNHSKYLDSKKFNKYACVAVPCCQLSFSNCQDIVINKNRNSIHQVNKKLGIDYSDYCIDNGYEYGTVLDG